MIIFVMATIFIGIVITVIAVIAFFAMIRPIVVRLAVSVRAAHSRNCVVQCSDIIDDFHCYIEIIKTVSASDRRE